MKSYLSKYLRLTIFLIAFTILCGLQNLAVGIETKPSNQSAKASSSKVDPAEDEDAEENSEKKEDSDSAEEKAAPKTKGKALNSSARKDGSSQDKIDLTKESLLEDHPVMEISGKKLSELMTFGVGPITKIEDALAAAYNNNPAIAEQRAKLRATDELVPQALAGWRPTLDGTGQLQYKRLNQTGSFKDSGALTPADADNANQSDKTTDLRVTLKQPLYNGGKTIAATNSAEDQVKAIRAELVGVEQSTLQDAATTYLDLLQKSAEVGLAKNNQDVLRKELEQAKDKLKVGEDTLTSVAQAEAKLADSTTKLQIAKAELEGVKAKFKAITGLTPIHLVKPEIPQGLPKDVNKAIEVARVNNPAIIVAQFKVSSARHDIQVSRADLLPSVDFQAQAGRNEERMYGNNQNDQSLTVNLKVPLYEAGSIRSKVRQTHQTSEQLRINVETARRKAIEDVITAWENFVAARENIKNVSAQVRFNEISLEGTRQEMAVGSKILLDVLNAEQDLFNSRVSLVKAERDYLAQAYVLLNVMGKLTARDLKLKVRHYNPDVHYNAVRNKW